MVLDSITIVGMHKVYKHTYNFGNFTYLFGTNGSGKSTVIQAIQLALLGYIPGTPKTKAGVFSHANGDVMSVKLDMLDDGRTVSIFREWRKTESSVSSTFCITPESYDISDIIGCAELAILDYPAFIGMTANKLKDWFISFLPKYATGIILRSYINENLDNLDSVADTEYIESVIDEVPHGICSIADVQNANQMFKEHLAAKRDELARTVATISDLTYYEDCEYDESRERSIRCELAIVQTNLESAHKLLIDANIVDQYKDSLRSISNDAPYDSYEEDPCLLDLSDRILFTETHISDLSTCIVSSMSDIAELRYRLTSVPKPDANGQYICNFTGAVCESISLKFQNVLESNKSVQEQLDSAQNQLARYQADADQLKTELQELYNRKHQKMDLYTRKADLKQKISAYVYTKNPAELESDIAVYTAQLDVLHTELEKISANRIWQDNIHRLMCTKAACEQTIDVLKSLVRLTDVNGVQTKIMQDGFTVLTDIMDPLLQEVLGNDTIQSAFIMESAANSFSFGIRLGGLYVPYDLLSSGEKCIYALAMMIALSVKSSSALKLLIADDILDHLDDIYAERCFKMLYNQNLVCAVIAGVKKCNDIEVKNSTIFMGDVYYD